MDNGQELAFPFVETREMQGESISFGLTKREYFAGLAMQGVLSAYPHIHDYPLQASMLAIEHADALLRALSHSAGGE